MGQIISKGQGVGWWRHVRGSIDARLSANVADQIKDLPLKGADAANRLIDKGGGACGDGRVTTVRVTAGRQYRQSDAGKINDQPFPPTIGQA